MLRVSTVVGALFIWGLPLYLLDSNYIHAWVTFDGNNLVDAYVYFSEA